MTPAEIRQWQDEHGGPVEPEGPDANGITTYRAADGSFINVRRDGSLAMRGHGAPVAPSVQQSSTEAPRGMGMTQQELEALLARMGQLGPNDFREETKQEEMPNPASTANGGLDPQAPTTIKGPVVYRTWVKPGTNQRLTVKVNADGSYTQTFSGADPEIKPESVKPAAPKGDIQNIGGRWKEYNPATGRYDIDHGASTAPPTNGGTIVERNGQTFIIKPDGTASRVEGVPAETPKGTLVDRPDGSYLVFPDGTSRKVDGLPPKEPPSPYSQTVQDKDTGKWWGLKKDGSGWVEIPGGPGAQQFRSPGPAMPTFVVGMASDAIRQYADQLNAAVAAGPANGGITSGERDKRLNEALQLAQVAVNEAATIQRQNESNLNARVNLATTKYANEVDGLNNALKFVTDLNGKLEEGSTVGATAFAALLGMQAIARKRSGIDAIQPPAPGDQRSPQGQQIGAAAQGATAQANAQISRLTNPSNAQAVASDQQAVRAMLEAEQQAAAARTAAAAQPAAPAQAASPPASVPAPIMPSRMAPGAAAAAAPAPAAIERADDVLTVQAPDGSTHYMTRANWDASGPNQAGYTVVNAEAASARPGVQSSQSSSDYWNQQPSPQQGVPNVYPDMGPPATMPAAPGSPAGGNVQMAPSPDQDFAIMRAMQPERVAAPTPDMAGHPLLLRSEAESLPPWRIPPERLQEMEAAGVPLESIWSVPGVGRVA